MELLDKLGVDWKILIAQIVNFVILLAVLYRFLYRPVLKMMKERSVKIEKGVKQAEKMGEEVEKMKRDYEIEILKGRKEAGTIIETAKKEGEKMRNEMVEEAERKIEKSLKKAKETIRDEKNKMMVEIKSEVGEMVILATEKVIGEKLNKETDKKLVEATIEKIK
jgi:F-type H+-transporting ATPase subunit b